MKMGFCVYAFWAYFQNTITYLRLLVFDLHINRVWWVANSSCQISPPTVYKKIHFPPVFMSVPALSLPQWCVNAKERNVLTDLGGQFFCYKSRVWHSDDIFQIAWLDF